MGGVMTDKKYEAALGKRFSAVSEEEWKKYMEIVKKNHYSDEILSIEEMQFCYACYKKAR